MSARRTRARRRARRATIRRRRTLAALLALALVAAFSVLAALKGGAFGSGDGSATITLDVRWQEPIRLTAGRARQLVNGRGPLPIPATTVVSRGSARITYAFDREAARRQLAQAVRNGGRVNVRGRPVASRIAAPIVKQAYRNNCETAALQMLLATQGIKRDQKALQKELRRDGPLDPRTAADGTRIWGNPRDGFVGRVEGGGIAGGFGVYPKPLLRLARRWVTAVNLSGRQPVEIYRRLLNGHAVLAWIGLSDGPYESWRSPRGEWVTVNLGEHTVLLRGVSGDELLVNDPLNGERLRWSKADFESRWELLGRRAISG